MTFHQRYKLYILEKIKSVVGIICDNSTLGLSNSLGFQCINVDNCQTNKR